VFSNNGNESIDFMYEKKKIIEDLDELKLYIEKDVQYAIRQQILSSA
jgi:hypothetical protein